MAVGLKTGGMGWPGPYLVSGRVGVRVRVRVRVGMGWPGPYLVRGRVRVRVTVRVRVRVRVGMGCPGPYMRCMCAASLGISMMG